MKIFFRDGRVLVYNDGEQISIKENLVAINDKKGFWIAQIPIDVVERIDAKFPCSIKKRKNKCSKF